MDAGAPSISQIGSIEKSHLISHLNIRFDCNVSLLPLCSPPRCCQPPAGLGAAPAPQLCCKAGLSPWRGNPKTRGSSRLHGRGKRLATNKQSPGDLFRFHAAQSTWKIAVWAFHMGCYYFPGYRKQIVGRTPCSAACAIFFFLFFLFFKPSSSQCCFLSAERCLEIAPGATWRGGKLRAFKSRLQSAYSS